MNTVVIETINKDGVEWGVSLTDSNPEEKNYIGVVDKETAYRLQLIFAKMEKIKWDGTAELANQLFGENYGPDWEYENGENSGNIIVKNRMIKIGEFI